MSAGVTAAKHREESSEMVFSGWTIGPPQKKTGLGVPFALAFSFKSLDSNGHEMFMGTSRWASFMGSADWYLF